MCGAAVSATVFAERERSHHDGRMSMETRRLGSSGIEVSALGLGAMMFGAWGNADRDDCRRMVDMALDAGVNLLDTADIYDRGVSEEIVGAALRGRRDEVVLATKFGNPMDNDPAHRGGSRRWVRQAVTDSLRRLQVDHIDLYQMHRPDPDVPFEETLGALTELVDEGLIGAVGTSTFPAEQIVEAQWIADRDGRTRPTSEQPPYSVLCRGVERAVLPVCRQHDVGTLVWAPLNGGWLTGKYRRDQPPPASSRADREPDHFDLTGDWRTVKFDAVERLETIAAQVGLSLTGLALGFVLSHPAVSAVLIGPRTPEQLADLLAIGAGRLDADTLAAIDAVVPPGTTINPHDDGYDNPHLSPTRLRA
jgi:aryl-alcohol dehydrogenase-like predicted oxidoreductase